MWGPLRAGHGAHYQGDTVLGLEVSTQSTPWGGGATEQGTPRPSGSSSGTAARPGEVRIAARQSLTNVFSATSWPEEYNLQGAAGTPGPKP